MHRPPAHHHPSLLPLLATNYPSSYRFSPSHTMIHCTASLLYSSSAGQVKCAHKNRIWFLAFHWRKVFLNAKPFTLPGMHRDWETTTSEQLSTYTLVLDWSGSSCRLAVTHLWIDSKKNIATFHVYFGLYTRNGESRWKTTTKVYYDSRLVAVVVGVYQNKGERIQLHSAGLCFMHSSSVSLLDDSPALHTRRWPYTNAQ